MPARIVRYDPHEFVPWPGRMRIPYPYCRFCGLILLRNDATQRAVRRGCPVYAD